MTHRDDQADSRRWILYVLGFYGSIAVLAALPTAFWTGLAATWPIWAVLTVIAGTGIALDRADARRNRRLDTLDRRVRAERAADNARTRWFLGLADDDLDEWDREFVYDQQLDEEP